MKYNILYIFLIISSLTSCSCWKDTLITNGDENSAISNAITDFLNSSGKHDNDTVYSIGIENINNDIIAITISGTDFKITPTPETIIGSTTKTIPTQYLEKNGKLFYWHDNKTILTKDIIDVMSKYKIIDSMNVNGIVGIPEYTIDESKKGVHYYFCKNNFRNYKKIKTNRALGYHRRPFLDCN